MKLLELNTFIDASPQTRIIEYCIGRARRARCASMALMVDPEDRLRLIKFYRKRGFQSVYEYQDGQVMMLMSFLPGVGK